VFSLDDEPEPPPAPSAAADPQNWREELSSRVESFRQRRARIQPEVDSEGNLELDFDEKAQEAGNAAVEAPPAKPESFDRALETPPAAAPVFDLAMDEPAAAPEENAPREVIALDEPEDEEARVDTDEMSLGEPSPRTAPVEIEVDSPAAATAEPESEPEGIYLAPLGRRILAGLTDSGVLLLGAAIFGVIFWRFCGTLSLGPLNVFILGLIAVLVVFAYFAVFTVVAAATPGLLWMKCEVRNVHGQHPTTQECCWRAFGVLVSLSALMLGFIWACVDSDNLTWHDRMSGTVIAEATSLPEPPGLYRDPSA
jgi:uncharacterized RDD family membrane protein YckC